MKIDMRIPAWPNLGQTRWFGDRLLALQADVYRDMWERAMDGALEKLLQMSSDGSYFVGSVQVPKSQKGKTVFVRKVRPLRNDSSPATYLQASACPCMPLKGVLWNAMRHPFKHKPTLLRVCKLRCCAHDHRGPYFAQHRVVIVCSKYRRGV